MITKQPDELIRLCWVMRYAQSDHSTRYCMNILQIVVDSL